MNCHDCGREMNGDEEGLSRKLINRGTTVFYCLTCLSKEFEIPEKGLLNLIERYRAAGCTLFPTSPPKK